MEYFASRFLSRTPSITSLKGSHKSKHSSDTSYPSSPLRTPSPLSHPAEPLPTSPTALEGLLNQHASQLQKLADRVDSINESIDLDNIVLHRHKREQLAPKGDANGNGTGMIKSKIHEVMVMGPSPGIMELERRLRAARTYKKELERSVLFHRNEYRRVESAMGKKRGSTMHHGMGQRNNSSIGKMLQTGATGKENGVMVVESRVQEGPRDGGGNGNGGAAPHVDEEWSRGCGRLPTQHEWESLFSD